MGYGFDHGSQTTVNLYQAMVILNALTPGFQY